MTERLKELIKWYYTLGFNLIPVPKGTKAQSKYMIRWKDYEEKRYPTLPDTYDGDIAVVLGETSDNDVCVDVDSHELFNALLQILPGSFAIKGYRGGHIHYKIDYTMRKKELKWKDGKIEVLGQGNIVMLPPSLHPEGMNYEIVNPQEPYRWRGDFIQELKEILETHLKIKIKSEPIDVERILKGVEHGERDVSAIQLATWFKIQGKTQEDAEKLLLTWNTKNNPPWGQHPTDKETVEDWVTRKVESAYKRETPYPYRFKQAEKKEEFKDSCGGDLQDLVFEQSVNGEFLLYNKETGEVTRQKNVKDFNPFEQIPWKPAIDVQPYEDIWREVKQYLYEHIDIMSGYDILTAWVLATWIPEKWDAVPYLFFYGPAGSGKTWGLEILASITFRPFMSASTTLPVIFRACDMWHPTLFLDETEVYMRRERSEIMHLLNAGYRRGFPATRMEDTKDGFKLKIFDCFGFKALAGTRAFVETLKSRCVIFSMSRATREIKTKIDMQRAEELRKKLLMYRFRVLSGKETLKETQINVIGRLRELFTPLLTVAPEGAKGSILNEAEKIEATTREEEQTGDEATVFRAIVQAHEDTNAIKISIERIMEIANEGLSPEETLSVFNVGRIASRLGFKKAIFNKQRCAVWNEDLAERLRKRYPAEGVQQQF